MEAVDLTEITQHRVRNAKYALAARHTDFESMSELVNEQVPDRLQLLLTSSLVMGLSTSTSDIDLIAVVREKLDEDRAPAQLFGHDRRVDLILYSEDEVDRSLKQLTETAEHDLPVILRRFREWPPDILRPKYLERVINGVSSELACPYLHHLGPLSRVWAIRSFDQLRAATVHTLLAQTAGERRSPLAYALRAVTHAMDVVMSLSGDVYSNPKWYALRWERFTARLVDRSVPPDLVDLIDRSWADLKALLRSGSADDAMGDAVLAIYRSVCGQLAFDPDTPVGASDVVIAAPTESRALSAEATMLTSPNGRVALFNSTGPVPTSVPTMDAIQRLSPAAAAGLLRASRSKMLDVSITSAESR